MGTRSLTIMHDDEDNYNGKEIVVMYRQFDGYPSGHGQELRDFLKGIKMVNGIGVTDNRRIANGGGCLAALIISHFKGDEVGGFYLHPAGTRNVGEEYIYHVYPSVKRGNIKVVTESVYGDESLDEFGKVWYNDGKGENKNMNQTVSSEPKEHMLRYSASKGQWLRIDEMHPCHILNAMRKELRTTPNEDVLSDPMFIDYFDVLSKQNPE